MQCEYFIVVAMCEWLYFHSFSMLHWSSWFLGSSETSKSAARRECFEAQKFCDLFFLFFIVLFKNVAVPIISTNILLKLILRNSVFGIWGLHCFGFLYSVDWYLIMDASGKPISPSERVKNLKFLFDLHWHLKMVLIVCPEISVNSY